MHRLLAAGALIVLGALAAPMTAGAAPTTTTAGTTVAALAHDAARSLAAPVPAAHPRASADLAVTISSNCAVFCFVPARLTIVVGDTVTWVNRTGTDHDVTRCNPGGCDGVTGGSGTDTSFTAGKIAAAAGASFSHRFTAPGTYVYYCTIHGYAAMHGTITVTAPAPSTTVAAPTVPSPVTPAPPPPTPGPITPPSPQLANTGAAPGSAIALAILFIVGGLAATRRPRRLRRSARVR